MTGSTDAGQPPTEGRIATDQHLFAESGTDAKHQLSLVRIEGRLDRGERTLQDIQRRLPPS